MSVVSAHGAVPPQLNAAPPSQTSNQSKEQSILRCLMFIEAADIRAASTSAPPQRLRHETTGFCNISRGSWGWSRAFVCLFNPAFIRKFDFVPYGKEHIEICV